MRYNGNDDELFQGVIMSDKDISYIVAFVFMLVAFLAGAWDAIVFFLGKPDDTVSEVVRNSWMRFPVAFMIAVFFITHFFIPRK